MSVPGEQADPGDAPLVEVIKGSPTDEELAALICVLCVQVAGRSGVGRAVERRWGAYWRNLRAPLVPGPSSWLGSGRMP